ncbi:MAG: ribosome maturation factor RimP [Myxococcales bacterium]|nr:ribosome maturation factor RimP [Myxococcales bacterium]
MSDVETQEQPKNQLKGKSLELRLSALTDPLFAAAGLDLIEFRMLRSPRGGLRLQYFVDRFEGEGGVLVDDCATISRKIGALLELEDPIAGAYDLEVSSPGMKRLLRHEADILRFAGFRARFTLPEQPDAPRRTLIGEIVGSDNGVVTLRVDGGKEESIVFADLLRATLDPTVKQWEGLGAQLLAERAARGAQDTDNGLTSVE